MTTLCIYLVQLLLSLFIVNQAIPLIIGIAGSFCGLFSLFLANHPAHDTARDVTELRGLAKSQVSAAVDLLAARELLRRQPDKADRRVIHLALTDAGAALAREGQKLQSTCLDALFAGLTQSEAERCQELLEKVLTSAEVRLKEGGNT